MEKSSALSSSSSSSSSGVYYSDHPRFYLEAVKLAILKCLGVDYDSMNGHGNWSCPDPERDIPSPTEQTAVADRSTLPFTDSEAVFPIIQSRAAPRGPALSRGRRPEFG